MQRKQKTAEHSLVWFKSLRQNFEQGYMLGAFAWLGISFVWERLIWPAN
jgi:hypothetical protein